MIPDENQAALLKRRAFKTLSRSISLIENEVPGYEDLLLQAKLSSAKMIGITGFDSLIQKNT